MKEKDRLALLGNTNAAGYCHSDKAKRLISLANKGKKRSEAVKANMAAAQNRPETKHKKSIASKNARNKPEAIKHTRAQAMKQLADPNCHFGWPKGESYPESIFRSFLESMGAIKGQDFFQEYHVGTYSLDFAYIDEQGKRDIEIDGNQHLLPKRREHDARRDQWLIQQGWIVFRITVKDLYQWLYSLGFDRISRTMNTGGSQHKM